MDLMPKVEMSKAKETEVNPDEPLDFKNTDEQVNELEDEIEEEVLEIEEKEKLNPNDVFKPKQQRIPERDTVPVVYKTKRPITEKQKEHLAKARQVAKEKRERNKQLREEGKQAEQTQKEKREQKVAERVAKKIPQTVNNTTTINQTITEEEIVKLTKKATAEALAKYDLERKARKADKQEKLQKQNQTKDIQMKIARATGRKYGDNGFFNDCF